jgi:hypothetical protein
MQLIKKKTSEEILTVCDLCKTELFFSPTGLPGHLQLPKIVKGEPLFEGGNYKDPHDICNPCVEIAVRKMLD